MPSCWVFTQMMEPRKCPLGDSSRSLNSASQFFPPHTYSRWYLGMKNEVAPSGLK